MSINQKPHKFVGRLRNGEEATVWRITNRDWSKNLEPFVYQGNYTTRVNKCIDRTGNVLDEVQTYAELWTEDGFWMANHEPHPLDVMNIRPKLP